MMKPQATTNIPKIIDPSIRTSDKLNQEPNDSIPVESTRVYDSQIATGIDQTSVGKTIVATSEPNTNISEVFDSHYQPWANGLSREERFSLAAYTDLESPRLLNEVLRDPTSIDLTGWSAVKGFQNVLDKVQYLDAAIDRTSTPIDLTIYRGIDHISFDEARSLVGTTIQDPSYGSSSLSKDIAGSFGQVILKINVPKDSKAAWLNHRMKTAMLGDEQELLFPRGYRLHINSCTDREVIKYGERTQQIVLEADLVPQGDVPSFDELKQIFSPQGFMQNGLDEHYSQAISNLYEGERETLSDFKKSNRYKRINKHLRGIETYETSLKHEADRIGRIAARTNADSQDVQAEVQKYGDYFQSLIDHTEKMDQVIDKLHTPHDMQVYVIDGNQFLKLHGDSLSDLAAGKEISDLGFTITSPTVKNGIFQLDKDGGKYCFEISIPKGSSAYWLDGNDENKHVYDYLALKRDNTYKVVGLENRSLAIHGQEPQIVTIVKLEIV